MEARPLNSLELFFYHRSKLNLHSCFYIALKFNKLPNNCQLSQALQKTIALFPNLRSNVTESLHFFQLPKINFDDVVETKDWDALTDDNINKIFKESNFQYHVNKPLWKLLVLPSENQIILIVDHVCFDGMSGVKFWHSLLENLVEETTLSSPIDPIFVSEQPMTIPIHAYDLWPIPFGWKLKRAVVKKAFQWSPYTFVTPDAQLLKFNDYSITDHILTEDSDPDQDRYNVRNDNCQGLIHFESNQVKKILDHCRSQNVTITTYIITAFTEAIRKQHAHDGSKIKIVVPMNTRPACKRVLSLPDDHLQMGNFVVVAEFLTETNSLVSFDQQLQDFQLELTKQSHSQIGERINDSKLLDVIEPLNYVTCKVKPPSAGTKMYTASTFELTNLGFQQFENSDFEVVDANFNGPQGIGHIFSCCAISTKLGGLNIHISYPQVAKDAIESCIDSVKEKMEQL